MISIKHNYTATEVVNRLRRDNPSKKQTDSASLAKWNKYVELITQAVQKSIILARSTQLEDNTLPIEWEKIYNALGKNRNFVYLNWFQKHFPLIRIIRKGIPGTLTMTEPLFEIEIAAACQTPDAAFKTIYEPYFAELLAWGDGDQSLVDYVEIDTRSLKAFIEGNIEASKKANNPRHLDALKANLIYAKTILKVSEYFESQGWVPGIPQIISESEFGRKYYKGVNLQNCPKVVRHAALGHCYQYDLHASVFAWRYATAKKIDPSIKLPYTLEYLDEKDQRRRQLANVLDLRVSYGKKIEIVKQLLTAIGFGSRVNNNGASWVDKTGTRQYVAINKIIKSPAARETLLTHPWLAGFIKEQTMLSKVIFNHYKETVRGIKCLEAENTGGRLSQNKVLAYLYQQDERRIMDILTDSSKQQDTFLLLIHDGFYTNRPVKLVELRQQLAQENEFAAITKEEHQSWGFNGNEQEHKLKIIDQELKANDGKLPDNVLKNYIRIDKIMNNEQYYIANDEFDNGVRLDTEYDLELDPFYDEDEEL
jgi:hypothetical protein